MDDEIIAIVRAIKHAIAARYPWQWRTVVTGRRSLAPAGRRLGRI